MAFIIQLQGHRWVKGLLHKTLPSHQPMAASRLYNNVISNTQKVFEAVPGWMSLQCLGALWAKWTRAGGMLELLRPYLADPFDCKVPVPFCKVNEALRHLRG